MYFTRLTRTSKFSAVPNVLCWISVLTSKSGLQWTFHSSIESFNRLSTKKRKSQVCSLVFFNPAQKMVATSFSSNQNKKTATSFVDFGAVLGAAPCDLKLHKYCGVRTNQRLHQGHQKFDRNQEKLNFGNSDWICCLLKKHLKQHVSHSDVPLMCCKSFKKKQEIPKFFQHPPFRFPKSFSILSCAST